MADIIINVHDIKQKADAAGVTSSLGDSSPYWCPPLSSIQSGITPASSLTISNGSGYASNQLVCLKDVTITKYSTGTEYETPTVTLSYPVVSGTNYHIGASGGSVTPTYTATVRYRTTYSDGSYGSWSSPISIASGVTFSGTTSNGSLDTSTGVVTANNRGEELSRYNRDIITVTASRTYRGKTGTASVTVVQQYNQVEDVTLRQNFSYDDMSAAAHSNVSPTDNKIYVRSATLTSGSSLTRAYSNFTNLFVSFTVGGVQGSNAELIGGSCFSYSKNYNSNFFTLSGTNVSVDTNTSGSDRLLQVKKTCSGDAVIVISGNARADGSNYTITKTVSSVNGSFYHRGYGTITIRNYTGGNKTIAFVDASIYNHTYPIPSGTQTFYITNGNSYTMNNNGSITVVTYSGAGLTGQVDVYSETTLYVTQVTNNLTGSYWSFYWKPYDDITIDLR